MNIQIKEILLEGNKFEKFMKKNPSKMIEGFAKNNVYRSNNIAPVNPYFSSNNKGFTNLIHLGRLGETIKFENLLKADRNLKREQFSNKDQFFTAKNIEQRKNKVIDERNTRLNNNQVLQNRFGNYDKNIIDNVVHGGGKYYIEGLVNGNSTMKGYPLEHNNIDKGIQVAPSKKLGNTMPDTMRDLQSGFYAARGPFINGDLPSKLSGNIKTEYLQKGGIDAEASIISKNLGKINNLEIKPFDYKSIQPDVNEIRSGPFNKNQYAYNIPHDNHTEKNIRKNIFDK